MITTFQELGDILAEFENRISAIENALPNVHPGIKDVQTEPQWVASQWDKVQQLHSEVQDWRQKHAEMMTELDKLNRKKKSKFD